MTLVVAFGFFSKMLVCDGDLRMVLCADSVVRIP